MNFKQWLEATRGLVNSTSEALQELGLSAGASKEEIMRAYRKLSLENHPDLPQNRDRKAECVMRQKRLNSAHDWFRDNGYNSSGGASRPSSSWSSSSPSHSASAAADAVRRAREERERRERRERERAERERRERERREQVPLWQTDRRSTYNDVGPDFRNVNYCKKKIFERSMAARYGADWQNWWPSNTMHSLPEYMIHAWDGHHFATSFSVFCDPSVLGYAGEVMVKWRGRDATKTEAVFASSHRHRELELIRLKDKDVADKHVKFAHQSFNDNPGNDQEFCRNLQHLLNAKAREWGMNAPDEEEPVQRNWHNPGPDVDGPEKWSEFSTTVAGKYGYNAESKHGTYHIDPVIRSGRVIGYRVKFANGGHGNNKLPNQGLWHEVTVDGKSLFQTAAEAKRAAKKHHKEIS